MIETAVLGTLVLLSSTVLFFYIFWLTPVQMLDTWLTITLRAVAVEVKNCLIYVTVLTAFIACCLYWLGPVLGLFAIIGGVLGFLLALDCMKELLAQMLDGL